LSATTLKMTLLSHFLLAKGGRPVTISIMVMANA
jgi:hypothetical protein